MKIRFVIAFMCTAVCAAAPIAVRAAACHATSGPGTTPLVELYTSEGCDSCPPADRWLAAHFPRTGDARPLALAFHVDYWDRLGWKDRFASPAWTERQYVSMKANRTTFVYTPQLLLQGHDFDAWQRDDAVQRLAEAAKTPPRASIDLTATTRGGEVSANATGSVTDGASRAHAVLRIAYVDSGLVSDVKAGENRGVRLTHDHVVRALASSGTAASAGSLQLAARFTRPTESGVAPTLIAFVQRSDNGDVLQAVALPVSECPL